MPANLVPHAAIPDLASRVTADMLKVLRHIQKADFIMNSGDMDPATLETLQQLTELELVDPGYEGDTSRPPYMWVANGNGSRVLAYRTGIRGGPHYELPSTELAEWLEEQGSDRWWNIDGDPLLTGRMTFPCPAALLARELRKINRPLIVQARKGDEEADGRPIGKGDLDRVVTRLSESIHQIRPAPLPAWAADRSLYLCWADSRFEWILSEDSRMTQLRAAEEARAREKACVKKE